MERLLTAKQVAEVINVSTRTVYRRENAGDIPSYRVGTAIRFNLDEVMMAMKGGKHARKDETRR